jgi:hypothetical protein
MASYAEDLARWRAERKQQEIANRLEQIKTEHAEAARERDIAIANNDMETAEFRDMDAEQLEQEYQQIVGPQRPQMHPASVEFLQKNRAFVSATAKQPIRQFSWRITMQRVRGTRPRITPLITAWV